MRKRFWCAALWRVPPSQALPIEMSGLLLPLPSLSCLAFVDYHPSLATPAGNWADHGHIPPVVGSRHTPCRESKFRFT